MVTSFGIMNADAAMLQHTDVPSPAVLTRLETIHCISDGQMPIDKYASRIEICLDGGARLLIVEAETGSSKSLRIPSWLQKRLQVAWVDSD